VDLLDRIREDLGLDPRDAGDPTPVAAALAAVRARAGGPFPRPSDREHPDEALWLLRLWTELFSLWSAVFLDPWLAARPERGVHLLGFPPPLAALAEVEAGRALRFESCVAGRELANGYRELRDPGEQRRRFERVNRLRAAQGLAPLPLDEAFLRALLDPGLPACCGAALGLDRLIAVAAGCRSLTEIELV
jgi:lysyl-tRNA synthetase class 2